MKANKNQDSLPVARTSQEASPLIGKWRLIETLNSIYGTYICIQTYTFNSKGGGLWTQQETGGEIHQEAFLYHLSQNEIITTDKQVQSQRYLFEIDGDKLKIQNAAYDRPEIFTRERGVE